MPLDYFHGDIYVFHEILQVCNLLEKLDCLVLMSLQYVAQKSYVIYGTLQSFEVLFGECYPRYLLRPWNYDNPSLPLREQ